MLSITTHTIVKNEENWVWYSLNSVKDYVTEMLVFDDNSTDKTWDIIKSIKDPKIKAEKGTFENASEIRNKMLEQTKTDWFLILDGDEIWNKETFKKLLEFLENCPKDVWGVVMKSRNCVGDVYHYQPESAGKYRLLGKTGNLNIRAYRKLPNLRWQWDFPRETYGDLQNRPINSQEEHLRYFDGYYWHMTFLPRTSVNTERKYRQITKIESGIEVKDKNELPEVIDVFNKRSIWYKILAKLISPVLDIKRKFS